MKGEKLQIVRGSGNVFRDLGRENADVEQLKALLAGEIIKALDRDGLTANPQCRPRQVYVRSADVDPQSPGLARRG